MSLPERRGKYGANQIETLVELARLDYALAEKSFAHFFKAAWTVLEPAVRLRYNWHHELVAEYLQATLTGQVKRLIINMPPRYSKSLEVTVTFPAWVWVNEPTKRFIVSSYSQSLSTKHSVDRRLLIESPWYQAAWGDRFRLSDDQNQKMEFTNTKRGHMVATSMLGTVTGKGGDCLPAGSLVETEAGLVDIVDLVGLSSPPRVLSFSHERGAFEWRKIEAGRVLASDGELVEIQTQKGRTLRCTPDHKVFVAGRGYVAAAALIPGDRLISSSQGPGLSRMRQAKTRSRSDLPGMLAAHSAGDQGRIDLSFLRQPIHETSVRGAQAGETRTRRRLLLKGLLSSSSRDKESTPLRDMRPSSRKENATILPNVSRKSRESMAQASTQGLSGMRQDLSTLLVSDEILRQGLRQPRSLETDARSGKLPLQNRDKLRQAFRRNEPTSDHSARRRSLRRLQKASAARLAFSSSRRRGRAKQRALQSRAPVPTVPYASPQVESDAVTVARRIRTRGKLVYDIQVEGNRNFVAQGLLVHNCVIIDDPHNPKKAESDLERSACLEAFDTTFTTRLDDKKNGVIIVVMQRLHEKDLSGHLLAKGLGYEHVCLPGEAPRRQVIKFPVSGKVKVREEGELLHPAREGKAEIEAQKKALGSYGFAGQYDQAPAPRKGGLFKRHYWKWYTTPPAKFDRIISSWDLSFKDQESNDYVCGFVIGAVGADRYFLDCTHDHLGFRATRTAIKNQRAKWPACLTTLIEDKANGPAVVDDLKSTLSGLIAEPVSGSKWERACLCEPELEAGNVYLPAGVQWATDLVEEAAKFPRGDHDDRVDAATQGLNYLRGKAFDRLRALGKR